MVGVRGSISKISFPVYERCSELETEPFWKQFFSDLSKGKTPRSLFIAQNGDIYKYRKASKLLVSSSKSPEEIITDSKSILAKVIVGQREPLNLLSKQHTNALK